MFIWTFTRKKAVLAVLLFGAILAAVILLLGRAPDGGEETLQLTNNDERVQYLQSLGWEIEEEPLESLQFLLPETLEEPYLSYNELQKKQGFDLAAACGKQVSRYTYRVANYPNHPTGVQVNLYICEDIPIAGDVFCAGENGFQDVLTFCRKKSPAS